METNNKKLTIGQMYSYSLGEFGFTFFLMFVGYYLMYYLTNVLYLPSAMAAFLYTLVQWFETITIVLSGAYMDRVLVKNGKYGKYRPWLLIGGGACLIGTVLFFTKFNIPTSWYWVVFPLFYLIAYWGYNFQWVAYRAINGLISKTPEERTSVTIKSSQMSAISALVFSFVAVKILYGFEKIETGFTVSALLYTSIMFLCLCMVAKVAKPYDVVAPVSKEEEKEKKIGFFESLKCLEGPLLLYFISSILRNSVTSIVNALMVYHFTLRLQRADLMTWYISTTTVGMLIGVTLAEPVIRKFGKKPSYIVSSIASACILTAAYFLSMNPYAFIACMTLNNFAAIFGGTLIAAFLNDIAEYNEVERNLNTRSLTISLGAASITGASLLGGATASFGLAAIGYDATAVMADSVLVSITKLCTLLPAALMLLCIIPMFFYKLDDKKMKEVAAKKAELDAKKMAEQATVEE